ncbi:MAG: N-acetylglucosamine-1-phosphate uridyltransferase / Glucosamine-1-phosphate N-acetyltransferase, partial [uncultured Phycisphaerae bacterium]
VRDRHHPRRRSFDADEVVAAEGAARGVRQANAPVRARRLLRGRVRAGDLRDRARQGAGHRAVHQGDAGRLGRADRAARDRARRAGVRGGVEAAPEGVAARGRVHPGRRRAARAGGQPAGPAAGAQGRARGGQPGDGRRRRPDRVRADHPVGRRGLHRDRRAARRDGGAAGGPGDQRQPVLRAGRRAAHGARPADEPEQEGRVLPDRRVRHPAAGRQAGGGRAGGGGRRRAVGQQPRAARPGRRDPAGPDPAGAPGERREHHVGPERVRRGRRDDRAGHGDPPVQLRRPGREHRGRVRDRPVRRRPPDRDRAGRDGRGRERDAGGGNFGAV